MQLSSSWIPWTECSSVLPRIYSTIVFTISTLKMEPKDSSETWQLSNRPHVWGSTKADCRAADHSTPQPSKSIVKKTQSCDTEIWHILRDLPFSQNRPPKSAEDWHIRILKNKCEGVTVKCFETERTDNYRCTNCRVKSP